MKLLETPINPSGGPLQNDRRALTLTLTQTGRMVLPEAQSTPGMTQQPGSPSAGGILSPYFVRLVSHFPQFVYGIRCQKKEPTIKLLLRFQQSTQVFFESMDLTLAVEGKKLSRQNRLCDNI